MELLSARGGALRLRLAAHTLTLTMAGGGASLAALTLEPPTVPVADLLPHAARRPDVALREVRPARARAAVLRACAAGARR